MLNETNMPPRVSRKRALAYLFKVDGIELSTYTLEKFASQGGGPLYHKLGGRIYYYQTSIDTWVQSRTSPQYRSTSHEASMTRTAP